MFGMDDKANLNQIQKPGNMTGIIVNDHIMDFTYPDPGTGQLTKVKSGNTNVFGVDASLVWYWGLFPNALKNS